MSPPRSRHALAAKKGNTSEIGVRGFSPCIDRTRQLLESDRRATGWPQIDHRALATDRLPQPFVVRHHAHVVERHVEEAAAYTRQFFVKFFCVARLAHHVGNDVEAPHAKVVSEDLDQ